MRGEVRREACSVGGNLPRSPHSLGVTAGAFGLAARGRWLATGALGTRAGALGTPAIALLLAGLASALARADAASVPQAALSGIDPASGTADMQQTATSSQPAATLSRPAAIRTERELREAWEVYAGLRGTERLRHFVQQARGLLERHDRDLPAADWQALDQALFDHEYAPGEAARKEAAERLEQRLAQVRAQLAAAVPPVFAFDVLNDGGTKVWVGWQPNEYARLYVIERQEVGRDGAPLGEWEEVGAEKGADAFQHKDEDKIRVGHRYRYRVLAVRTGADRVRVALGVSEAAAARPQWINTRRLPFLVFMGVFCGSVVFYIGLARRGVRLKVRKIAGLEAVDEAVGRATEMGRLILFIPGIGDMNDIQTVAGLTVLGRVGRTAAEHEALLEVPTCASLVMTTARETLQASYASAGRPDAYDEQRVYFTTGDQFGYAAAVTGRMVRQRPATCFYMGSFFAEALILAETANTVGAIQIAGTAEAAQLPFFVAACDYTLIGEEFFAASAYLSGEPQQLGSLKGQDVGKVIVLLILSVGVVLATLCAALRLQFSAVGDVLDWLQEVVLNVASA